MYKYQYQWCRPLESGCHLYAGSDSGGWWINDVKIIVRYGLHGFHKVFYSFCGIRVKSVTDKNGFTWRNLLEHGKKAMESWSTLCSHALIMMVIVSLIMHYIWVHHLYALIICHHALTSYSCVLSYILLFVRKINYL